ncbi:MAG: endonuclease/exonuclease/phosphatase family protein [Verrucomicrobiota bacterium]|nr:endonuclease/exonuclease/phosphatase family protein [Verrucomicrobiota bacterium]
MNETTQPTLRVATYNVHGCFGMDRRRSEDRIVRVIAELSADIVGLQELDRNRRRSAGVDQAGLIAEQLGWHRFFHPALRRGDEHFGNAILSRYPLVLRRAGDLPGTAPFYCRENRGAISMEVETPLGLVHIINTHFGLGRSERLLQAQMLTGTEWLGATLPKTPLIMFGDFNTLPGSRTHRALTKNLRDVRKLVQPTGPRGTFPTSLPRFAVDHIFINSAVRALRLVVHRTPLARMASDHFPLVCDLERASDPEDKRLLHLKLLRLPFRLRAHRLTTS